MAKRVPCPVEGHLNEWIEVREKISIGEWNRWRKATHDETQALLVGARGLVADWNLIGENGEPAPKPSVGMAALEALDFALLGWLIPTVTSAVLEKANLLPQTSSPSPT